MIVLLMGVTASGKSTVGRLLADRLGWTFYDGDDYHPPANVAKMSRGIPLTDEDRLPWLDTLNGIMRRHEQEQTSAIVASSALKASYRERLARDVSSLVVVFLKGEPEILQARLDARRDHFMPRTMLPSQLAALEEPKDAIVVDAGLSPETIVGLLIERLEAAGARPGGTTPDKTAG
jgi:gluconokinase